MNASTTLRDTPACVSFRISFAHGDEARLVEIEMGENE
jgi:hypothetical protein